LSDLERLLQMHMHYSGLPAPEREYAFHPTRKWRFDFAFPRLMIAIEAEGGTWTGGRHTRGAGFAKDSQKYNEAAIAGWCVLRFPAAQIKSGEALTTIERAIAARYATPAEPCGV